MIFVPFFIREYIRRPQINAGFAFTEILAKASEKSQKKAYAAASDFLLQQ